MHGITLLLINSNFFLSENVHIELINLLSGIGIIVIIFYHSFFLKKW
jgi:hypothetical protein